MKDPNKSKGKCEIVDRRMGYVSMDCYGYTAICSCGEQFHEWSAEECEKKAQEHLNQPTYE